ncbi:MAG: transposase orfA, family [Myxococcales bacterium]|nr:transposase orfA, family [Myxococcales bacterium]
MGMRRHALTDEQWQRLRPVLPKPKFGPRAKIGDREFVDAVLYRGKTGVPWRDLPERFGSRPSAHRRHRLRLDALVREIRDRGMKPVICCAVASRYDKTAVNYLGMVEVACTWLWLS